MAAREWEDEWRFGSSDSHPYGLMGSSKEMIERRQRTF